MRKIFAITTIMALVAGGVFFLLKSPKEVEGYVIDKVFEERHTTTIMTYNAATKTMMPTIITQPDRYYLIIEEGPLGDRYKVRVSEMVFGYAQEGDWFSNKEND